jgi:thiol-disulfide isomerase/thioredoxin
MAQPSVVPLPTGGGSEFSLAKFVSSVSEPLVCLKFGAQWCGPCKQVAPLFEGLAQSAAGAVKCFAVDVDDPVGEQVAVEAKVSQLPTFVFYTTQLSPNKELQVIETVVGTNAEALKVNFSKGVQIVQAFVAAQKQGGSLPVPPSSSSSPPPQQAQQQGAISPIKQELLEIRATLVASLQRIERLYNSLQ